MELEHFSHEHPLMLMEDDGEKKVIEKCSGCDESMLEYPYYQCSSNCNFVLHKSCAELPDKMQYHFHPNHLLFLQAPRPNKICDVCEENCGKCFIYRCDICDFDVHIKCVRNLKHFSHKHPLMLMEEQGNDGEKKVNVCSGCEESVLEYPYYQCSHCNFVLHKSCAELHRERHHPLHPEHSLFLQAPSKFNRCDACRKHCGKCFFYRCEQCDYDLCIKCASRWQISIGGCLESHAFIPLCEQLQFTCKTCGEKGKHNNVYLCTICRLLIHHRCTLFSRTIILTAHNHSLTLTYSLQDQVKEPDNLFCRLCYKRVNIKYAAYYCQDCNYAAHLQCGLNFAEIQGDTRSGIQKRILEVKSVVETYKGDREINHFSHGHKLTLITDTEEELKDDQHCAGCMRQISAPFYSCAQCNFFIHLRCAQLPSQMHHPLHKHELTLCPQANSIDGVFFCNLCRQHCHGFTYTCNYCDNLFNIDVQCGSTPENLKHEGHQHPIFLANIIDYEYETCSACDDSKDAGKFVCTDCNFTLGFRCATLPRVVRHIDHCRLLTLVLTYKVEDNFGEYYCLICEQERDPNHWFCYSADYDFAAHTQCVLGKYPYIKFGGIYTYDRHQHPLTLVQRNEHNPPCEVCHKPFVGLALQCAQCNFNIHREGYCFWELAQEGGKGNLTYKR